ncbi:phosphatidylethanolamine:Kdo2-lipid A phosphoethanolamine transferase [Rhizobium sp. RU35A]|uniref:phosphoethanolamine transferase n=1 Tax=Rhizobium sp. RU35A TaxID=1907414 RepID=UPI0009551AFA|nr:phosphoethanolamine--lipid A transferase [Rhizobium sp. RU35A]SIQ44258.1 phosphatidylethanolamine:Kdo2-lipid A phosphoethanolamine transferase [Rhizobium sp. RU35A]
MSFHVFFARRPRLGSVTLSIIVALYILVLLNQTFWSQSLTVLSGQHVALAGLAVALTGAFIAFFVSFSVKYLMKPLLIFFVFIAAGAAWFMDQFGVIIDSDMIRNAAETTSAEAGHLITAGYLLHMAVYAVLPSLLIAWVRVAHRTFPRKVMMNLAVIVPALLVFGAAALANAGTYAFTIRQNREWFATLNPFMPIANAVAYLEKLKQERGIVVQPYGTDAKVADGAKAKDRKPRVTIIVVGETARGSNFSLGGYERLTNPELAKRDIFYFDKAQSCGTATAISVPCMFSGLGRSDYSHAGALERQNLMDVLVHAGIRAEWWDNNTGSKGVAARIPYKELYRSTDSRYCENGECKDDILLDQFDAWLSSVTGDSVLVLHQLGSHGPAYYARYPDAYRTFQPDCRSAEFSKCHRPEIINAYDNSIVYTDHILATIIDKLTAVEGKVSPSMIYMSDHGESLGEKGLFLHGAPWVVAPEQQTHIPFLLWLGKDAKAGIDTACMDRRKTEPVSHDNLFHTVLGLMHVQTKVREAELDLTAACPPKPAS